MTPLLAQGGIARTAGILVVVAAAALGAFLLQSAFLTILRRRAEKTASKWDDALVRSLHPGLPIASAIAVLAAGIKGLGPRLGLGQPLANATITLAISLLTAFVLSRAVAAAMERHVTKHPQRRVLVDLLRRILLGVIYSLALLSFLDAIGVRITPILASLGITGIALALALQDSLSNLFAGVWMRSTRDVRIGHQVHVQEGGFDGQVVAIGWRTTRLRTRGNDYVILPNGLLAKSAVVNYSLPDPRTSATIQITVGLDADGEAVVRAIEEEAKAAAEGSPSFAPGAPMRVRLSGLDGGQNFTLTTQVRDVTEQEAVEDLLRRRVLARLRRDGVRLA